MSNSSYDDLITTTIEGRSKKLADNITTNNALLSRLNSKGNIREATGRVIVEELIYAENESQQWYSGLETLDVSQNQTLTGAEFDYKQSVTNVVMSGLDAIKNSGPKAYINLAKARYQVAEKTMMNKIAAGLFATGTGNDGKEIGGLRHIVSDTPTSGIVGGIDRSDSDNVYWRNKTYDFSDNSTTASSTTIQSAMNTLFVSLVRGADKPDMIVADSTYWVYYLESLQAIQRVTKESDASAGFATLSYMNGIPVFHDANCPSAHMYMLNTDYLHFRPAKGKNMSVGKKKEPFNQDGYVIPIYWAGNMTTSNASLQGVIKA